MVLWRFLLGKCVAEHREAAPRRLTGGLVLNHIPMLDENTILYSNHVRYNPVHRQAVVRVCPCKVPFRFNRS